MKLLARNVKNSLDLTVLLKCKLGSYIGIFDEARDIESLNVRVFFNVVT